MGYALLETTTMEGLNATSSSGHQFETKLAYGFPIHSDHITLTPAVALALPPIHLNQSRFSAALPSVLRCVLRNPRQRWGLMIRQGLGLRVYFPEQRQSHPQP